MNDSTTFPGWIEDVLLPDTRFARAYERTGDSGRAVLKSAIAELYAVYPPGRATARLVEEQLSSGVTCRRETTPVAWVLLVVDEGFDAPVGLLAALVPALTSGAAEVLVVRAGRRRFTDSCLAAMELCGQESVLEISRRRSRELVSVMLERPEPGRVLFLGGDAPACGNGAHACLHLAADQPLGVYCEPDRVPGAGFDIDRLLFAQAGRRFEFWNMSAIRTPGGATHRTGALEDFLSQGYAAAWLDPLDAGLLRSAPSRPRLVLGLGREGTWLWSGIDARVFSRECLVLRNSGVEGGGA